jgi:hypothetical protein
VEAVNDFIDDVIEMSKEPEKKEEGLRQINK